MNDISEFDPETGHTPTPEAPQTQISDIQRPPTKDSDIHRFHYKPLDRTKGAVRLLRIFPLHPDGQIRCRIERHHISTTTYTALSYVWGPANDVQQTILLNGQTFSVRHNLHEFLLHAARSPSLQEVLFWIDAISINQEDVAEKNGHVRHIGTIYGSAERVIAWLGEGSRRVLAGRRAPRKWSCCKEVGIDRANGTIHRCDWKVPWSSSWAFVMHEYWSRLWIAQELALSSRVDVLWQGRFYSWRRLRAHLIRAKACRKGAGDRLAEGFFQTMAHLQHLPIAKHFASGRAEPLGNLVPRYCFHDCQVGHDHVFALLSMATDGADFEPDYSESPLSLLFRLLTFCYAHPTTSLLKKLGGALDVDPRRRGVVVEVLGPPKVLDADSKPALIRYSVLDSSSEHDTCGMLLVRLSETNLHLILRRKSSEGGPINGRYEFLSRMDMISTKVDDARHRFGSNGNRGNSNKWTVTAEQEDIFIILGGAGTARLFCSWSVLVAIFDSSYAEAKAGRLESRIRRWRSSGAAHDGDRGQYFISSS